jgi:non-heme chloroperoxidase
MPYAKAKDGTQLYYKDWGTGDPVVLLHGWPLTADTWDDAACALVEAGKRCIMPDRRGFGRSDQPWDGHDYDTYADDVAAILEDAGIKRAGRFGRLLDGRRRSRALPHQAGRQPRLEGGADQLGRPLHAADRRQSRRRPAGDVRRDDAGMKEDREHFFTGFFKTFFGDGLLTQPVSSEVEMNAWRQAMMAGLRPTLAAAQAFATTDFRPDLASFTVPTLVIHGTADKTVPIDATGRVVAKQVPGAELIEYDGSAHGLFATDKQRLIDDLVAFLGSSGTGADQRSAIPLSQTAY